MISVSIVLATYNGERYLARQLESLAWQSELPAEVIVNDDQSSDGTFAILTDFARRAPFPVRAAVNDKRLNFRRNFLKGVALASSEVIMFCDQDDVWRPEKIAVMCDEFRGNPDLLLAYHDAMVVDEQERPIAPIGSAETEREAVRSCPPPPWHFARGLLQAFRRELTDFDDLWPLTLEHFSDDMLGHDRWYMMLAHALGEISYVDRDLLLYRQHGANAYGSDAKLSRLGRIRERLRHHPESDAYGEAAARSRIAVFQALKTRVSADRQERLQVFIDSYARLAARLARRRITYCAPNPLRRGMALARSVASGDYCGNPWGFDPRSIMRDAVSGVSRVG